MVCVCEGGREPTHIHRAVWLWMSENNFEFRSVPSALLDTYFFLLSAVCVRLAGPQASAHCSVCIFHLPKVRALEMLDLQTHLTMVLNFASVLGIFNSESHA